MVIAPRPVVAGVRRHRLQHRGWLTVRWEDQQRPWFVLDVAGCAANVPVTASLTGATAGAQ
jgi:hypothetical protein